MSELAQRIITSHKEAAKRAVAHLGKTRKLKLSSTESLELVACVLGVANWQTLLALANDGRGPRIDEGKPAPVGEAVQEKSIAQRLSDYYATPEGWGTHPDLSREDWQYLVENGDTGLGYWEHVEEEIDRLGMMLPWERDAMFDYKLTQIAGVGVEWSSEAETDNEWLILDPWGYIFASDGSTEEEALKKAASSILSYVSDKLSMRAADFERISEAEWLAATARVHTSLFAAVPAADETSSDDLDEGYSLLPGEMTKDSRKFSEDVSFCRELGIKAVYTDEREGYHWTTGEDRFFTNEALALNVEVNRVRMAVINAMDIAPDVWDKAYDLDKKIALAKQHCTWLLA